MADTTGEMDFLDLHKEEIEVRGFWSELTKNMLISMIESSFKKEIIREHGIVDIALVGTDQVLINWQKRFFPLSDEELAKRGFN